MAHWIRKLILKIKLDIWDYGNHTHDLDYTRNRCD